MRTRKQTQRAYSHFTLSDLSTQNAQILKKDSFGALLKLMQILMTILEVTGEPVTTTALKRKVGVPCIIHFAVKQKFCFKIILYIFLLHITWFQPVPTMSAPWHPNHVRTGNSAIGVVTVKKLFQAQVRFIFSKWLLNKKFCAETVNISFALFKGHTDWRSGHAFGAVRFSPGFFYSGQWRSTLVEKDLGRADSPELCRKKAIKYKKSGYNGVIYGGSDHKDKTLSSKLCYAVKGMTGVDEKQITWISSYL